MVNNFNSTIPWRLHSNIKTRRIINVSHIEHRFSTWNIPEKDWIIRYIFYVWYKLKLFNLYLYNKRKRMSLVMSYISKKIFYMFIQKRILTPISTSESIYFETAFSSPILCLFYTWQTIKVIKHKNGTNYQAVIFSPVTKFIM